jgi:hypothetical protein
MAADTSSPPAAITLVVEAAAAALASLSEEPMPATSAADAANMSGAAITFDIVASDPSHRSISEKQKRVGLPARHFECDEVPAGRGSWFLAHLFSSMLHAKMAGWSPEAPHYKTKPGAEEYAEGKRLWKNNDPVDRNLQGPE